MPEAVIHPTSQELTAFGLGKLPEGATARIAAHLESCPACRQAVAGVSADSFLDKVRDARQGDPSFALSSVGQPSISAAPRPNLPPELAHHPKYDILRELGRGGMGVVYQARHKEMERQVVIKVINRSLLDRPDSLERFRREIRSAAQLSHPNIVAAYDAERAGESHMLVMEFVPGRSLAEVVHLKGRLPINIACHFARQVALGLQHAYERGMVHRDIKPHNLMLTPNGQVKILDFGLAKVVSERGKDKGLTSSDACMGTPEYIAPEQAQNAAKADIRADLYSLGCTLYCLVAGRPPFRADTWMNTVLAHIQKEPQPLPELRPEVSAELWQVVARLLAKDPAQRYEKPIEVAQALAPFIKSGSRQDVKGDSAPAADVSSPRKGTMIAADTGEIKRILREVPGKTPPKAVPAKEAAASPFADLTDSGTASEDVVRVSEAAKPYLAAWWKRPGVLAVAVSVSLALILMAAIVIKMMTAEGILVVEVNVPNSEVWIKDKKVTVSWHEGGKKAEIRVKPGTYKVEVRKDGFIADGKDLTFKDGDKVVFTAQLLPKKPPLPHNKVEPDAEGIAGAADDDKNKDRARSPASEEEWIREVRDLPAKQQIEKVKAKLKERNPGFEDWKEPPTIEDGSVTGLEFVTDHVMDLSPLHALPRLKSLACKGSGPGKGKLADLSPLKGMHLTRLDCWGTLVSDLSPLMGMQLTYLGCSTTQVSDLSPLKGMPLTTLWCDNTRVSDLSPLKGMQLRYLTCFGTAVSDLSPLDGMPLKVFRCASTQVSDLSPLKGMPLEDLWFENTGVTDLSPLKGMPLKVLVCKFRPEQDTEILRSIKTLEKINGEPAAELLKAPAPIPANGEKRKPGEAVRPPNEINQAVNAGVIALRRLQRQDGTWPHQYIGATALAGLTLLECGADKQDQAVLRAADAVRKASIDLTHTYSISLSVLFLDRLGDREDKPLIESLTARLLAGQDPTSGGWSYGCPPLSEGDKQRLQENLNKRKKAAPRPQLLVPKEDLPQLLVPKEDLSSRVGGLGDNSNTQFAALGLWSGHRHGVNIDRAVTRLADRFRKMQMEDGGWPYAPPSLVKAADVPVASTPSMTCAGLIALAIADAATLERARKRNPNLKLPVISNDKNLKRGLEALGAVIDNPKVRKPQQPAAQFASADRVGGRSYYFLWSLERVAMALDRKAIGKKDWYGWGAEVILQNQEPDGSWLGDYAAGGVDTCFALLFLKRANLTPDLTTLLRAR